MIAHIVLFTPRHDLDLNDRRALAAAFEHAITAIPEVTRARVGRLARHGAGYEATTPDAPQYGAIIEFENIAALQAYLQHEAHEELGRRLWESTQSVAVYDYEVGGVEGLASLV